MFFDLAYTSPNVDTLTLTSNKMKDVNFLLTKTRVKENGFDFVIISILIKPLENKDGYPFWPLNSSGLDKYVYTKEATEKITKEGVTVKKEYAELLFPNFKVADGPPPQVQTYINFDMSVYKMIERGDLVTFIKSPH